MTDVLLVSSYILRLDPKEYRAMMPYPPLGTLYAASVVRGLGYSVALFDSMLANGVHEFREAVRVHRPRVVVIYDDDFNYLTKMCLSRMREASFALSAIARAHGATVIVHGSDPVDHRADYFAHGAEFIISGEGERTLASTLNFILRQEGKPEDIHGLAFMEGGAVCVSPPREVMRDLDSLPFPARDLVDIERYRKLWKRRHGYFSVNMVTTRGCPFHCNWCAKPIYGQVYNSRTPYNVVEEMVFLKNTIRPDHLWFCDDIFGLKPGWVEQFDVEVSARDARIPFKCLSRVDLLLKGDVIPHLRHAGCQTIWVGAESGSQKILDAMEKGTTVEQIYAASRKLKDHGIRVGFFLQYGYPGEDRADIELTFKMLRDCAPDDIGVSVSYPLPGTRFFEHVREQLGEKQNWLDSQDLDPMIQSAFPRDFYRTLHMVTHKRFRLWQGTTLLKQAASRPWTLSSRSLRRIGAAAYHWATLGGAEKRLSGYSSRKAGSAGD